MEIINLREISCFLKLKELCMEQSFFSWFIICFVIWEVITQVAIFVRVNYFPGNDGDPFRPKSLDARHCVLFLILTVQYHFHCYYESVKLFILAIFPFKRKPIDSELIVTCILESSLALFVKKLQEDNTDDATHVLDLEGFLLLEKKGISFNDKITVKFCINKKQISSFTFNDKSIQSSSDQLSILLQVVAQTTHPAIHLHQTNHYEWRKNVKKVFDRLFWHGPLLNCLAHYYPGHLIHNGLFSGMLMKKVLRANAVKFQPPVHNFSSLKEISYYSKSMRFALEARPLLFKLVRKWNIQVDPELFFINSVIHSLDHYAVRLTNGTYMNTNEFWDSWGGNLIRVFFFLPIRHNDGLGTNYLVDCKDEHPFYSELYDGLLEIDTELANWITLSISY